MRDSAHCGSSPVWKRHAPSRVTTAGRPAGRVVEVETDGVTDVEGLWAETGDTQTHKSANQLRINREGFGNAARPMVSIRFFILEQKVTHRRFFGQHRRAVCPIESLLPGSAKNAACGFILGVHARLPWPLLDRRPGLRERQPLPQRRCSVSCAPRHPSWRRYPCCP